MPKPQETFQVKVVGQSKRDQTLSFTVAKDGKKVSFWIETEDGEASVDLTEKMFNDFVTNTRMMMKWKLF